MLHQTAKIDRTTEHQHQCNGDLTVEVFPGEHLLSIAPLWRDLYANSTEPNPCYAPEYVSKIIEISKGKQSDKILAIKQTTNHDQEQLIALLPISLKYNYFGKLLPIITAQHTCFNGSTVPLIRTGYEDAALAELINWLKTNYGPKTLFIFKEFPLNGLVAEHLKSHLSINAHPWLINGAINRPLLDITSDANSDDYLKSLKGSTRQNLKRKMRKLTEIGDITHTVHTGKELQGALKEFAELENSGWKGRAGTSILQDPNAKALVFDTFASSKFDLARVESLRLDGKAIAMNIYLGTEKLSTLFKPTYDETYAKLSPGALLHFETVKQLYIKRWTKKIDSAVTEGDQIGSIWRQRQPVGDFIFGVSNTTPKSSISLIHLALNLKENMRKLISR